MRRILVILVLTGIIYTAGYGQRSYLGLSFGGSLPNDEFAKTSLQEDGGYALPGFVIEFAGAYIFDYYFGIAGTATFSSNPIDAVKFGEDLEAAIPPIDPPPAEDPVINIKVANWTYSNVMVGPTATLPLWRFNFDLRAVAGLSFLLSPPQEVYIQVDDKEFFQGRSNSTVNFAYMLGGGLRFNVNDFYGIRLSADYFRSKPTFKVSEGSLIDAATGKSTYEMDIGTINLNIGIAYRF
jgi:hypothetical protein